MYRREKAWRTDAGYLAEVLMTDMGHRCGYVGIPDSHSLYRKHYGDHTPELGIYYRYIEKCPIDKRGMISVFCAVGLGRVSAGIVFNVHGSITYSGGADWNCTYPVPNTNLWWFGYDCSHIEDGNALSGVVRSLEYCIGECESLAHQLKDAQEVYVKLLLRKWTQ